MGHGGTGLVIPDTKDAEARQSQILDQKWSWADDWEVKVLAGHV